jgi:hypothetical protein
MTLARYCIAASWIVFGVDHFLALGPIATLVPNWIPFHIFWVPRGRFYRGGSQLRREHTAWLGGCGNGADVRAL